MGLLEITCDFLNSTQGLDKLYRLISYLTKLLSSVIPGNAKLVDSLVRLGRNISHTRTVMRLVGLLHNLRQIGALNLESNEVTMIDWTTFKSIVRIITNFTYLPCDHLAWMGREKIVSMTPQLIDKFGRISAQSWLVGLMVEIVDLIKNLRKLFTKLRVDLRQGRVETKKCLHELKEDLKPLAVKSVLIIGDLPLAINYSLTRPILSPFVVGLCGTVSSSAALYLRWKQFHKEQ